MVLALLSQRGIAIASNSAIAAAAQPARGRTLAYAHGPRGYVFPGTA